VVTMFLLCTITAQAATYQCQTPPVTEAFLREIDGRITKLRDALQETGCVDRTRVTLFGLDFYPDPVPEGEENPQLTGQVFATGYRYLAQSMATAYDEGFGLKEFFLSIAGTQDSYQLQLDAKLVQDRFNTLRGLMGMTQQACAQDATLEGYSLARYAEVWYFTYRQLYYWLLLGKNAVLTEDEQKISESLSDNSQVIQNLGGIYAQLFAKRLEPASSGWYPQNVSCVLAPNAASTKARTAMELGQNFFACNVFYTPEYANGLQSTCSSPELGGISLDGEVDRLMESIDNVGPTFAEIGTAAEELGKTGNARWEDVSKIFTQGDLSGFVRIQTNLNQAKDALWTNLTEFLAPAEYASAAERFQEKIKEPLSSTGLPIQGVGLTGSASNTLLGVLQNQITEKALVDKELLEAYDAVEAQISDLTNIRREYLRGFDTINTTDFTAVEKASKAGADAVSTLCMRASPGLNQEMLCGVR